MHGRTACTVFEVENLSSVPRDALPFVDKLSRMTPDDTFRALLIASCERPGMYVGRASLWDLSHYLTGYCHGASDAGVKLNFNRRFQPWVEGKFGISSAAWNWGRILQHEYGDDHRAIQVLPDLYDEFRSQTDEMTDEQLWNMMEQRLIEKRGNKHWSPDDSETWTTPLSQSQMQ